MSVLTTACPRNCYSTCTLKVYLKNGKLHMIEPDSRNLATPEGVCLKGLSYVERVYSPDRILNPMQRNKKTGDFKIISWDDAFNIILENLTLLRDSHGPQSVLYYTGSGTKGLLNQVGMNFWRLFGGCTTTYGDLCWPAGLEATRLTLGENKHNAPWDMSNARLIILWGKNSAETNIHQMVFIEKAIESGARLVVIDPRRTQSSEQADLLVQPRPGSDGALALALAHLLISNNHIDTEFINNRIHGFDEFAGMVKEYTPARAAQICEISEERIFTLARMIADSTAVSINCGFGMQRYTNSGQTMRSIIALLAITGNIGKPGSGWIFANLQSAIFDAVKDPIAFYPPKKQDEIIRISIPTARLGEGILETNAPPIKMIWVERGNPVTQNPDTNKVRQAFQSVDFRVVVDQFLTDTAREADLILPAKTMFEQTDVIGAYWHPYIQLKQKIIDPPGEVKPESEIYYLLAKKMRYDVDIMADQLPPPSDKAIEKYFETKLTDTKITLDQLRQGPILAPGNQDIAFADYKFDTPSGKIELLSDQAKTMWQLDTLPIYKESQESVHNDNSKAKRYPLYFMTPNTKNRIHSQFNNLILIKTFSPGPFIHIHPDDAVSRGIKISDKVRLYNDRGELNLPVYFDMSLKPGCVSVTNGWWIPEGGTVNFCSLGRETDMGHGAAFHDNLVEVERIS